MRRFPGRAGRTSRTPSVDSIDGPCGLGLFLVLLVVFFAQVGIVGDLALEDETALGELFEIEGPLGLAFATLDVANRYFGTVACCTGHTPWMGYEPYINVGLRRMTQIHRIGMSEGCLS